MKLECSNIKETQEIHSRALTVTTNLKRSLSVNSSSFINK